jgi:hypothetical protein
MRDPVAEALLTSPTPARLAYIAPDGDPRVVPIGFLWNGDAFVVATATIAPKVAALQVNPKVALTNEWEAGVRQLCKSMARIVVTPDWPKILDSRRGSPIRSAAWPRSRAPLRDRACRSSCATWWRRATDVDGGFLAGTPHRFAADASALGRGPPHHRGDPDRRHPRFTQLSVTCPLDSK